MISHILACFQFSHTSCCSSVLPVQTVSINQLQDINHGKAQASSMRYLHQLGGGEDIIFIFTCEDIVIQVCIIDRTFNRNIRRLVYCQYGQSNVSSIDPSSERNSAQNVRLCILSILAIQRPFYISICISILPTLYVTSSHYVQNIIT